MKEFGQKMACITAIPLTYQKSAQLDNTNLYQKYPTCPETTEKQQKNSKNSI